MTEREGGSVEPDEFPPDETPGPVRIAAGTLAFAGLLVFVVVLLRMASPPVQPEQKVPKDHPPGPCWLCHDVDAKAKRIDIDEKTKPREVGK